MYLVNNGHHVQPDMHMVFRTELKT
jgi:hypothetical protein